MAVEKFDREFTVEEFAAIGYSLLLITKQGNIPQHLRDKITSILNAAPEKNKARR